MGVLRPVAVDIPGRCLMPCCWGSKFMAASYGAVPKQARHATRRVCNAAPGAEAVAAPACVFGSLGRPVAGAISSGHQAHLHNLVQSRHGVKVKVGRLAGEQLDGQSSHTPDVGLWREPSHLHNLRSHPVGCAHHRHAWLAGLGLSQLCSHAKVCQLDHSLQRGEWNELSTS